MPRLSNGQADWTYTLGTAAAQTLLTVTDANGKVVYAGAGGTAAGRQPFTWNGQDNNGNQLADGTYTLDRHRQGCGRLGRHQHRRQPGVVSEIDMTSGTPKLVVGGMELGLGDIANGHELISGTYGAQKRRLKRGGGGRSSNPRKEMKNESLWMH